MKKAIGPVLVLLVAVILAVFISRAGTPATELATTDATSLASHDRGVVQSIRYFKDARTGICFAYVWEGSANGGPALATVPCEAVPAALLRSYP